MTLSDLWDSTEPEHQRGARLHLKFAFSNLRVILKLSWHWLTHNPRTVAGSIAGAYLIYRFGFLVWVAVVVVIAWQRDQ